MFGALSLLLAASLVNAEVPLIRGEGTNEFAWTDVKFEAEPNGLYGFEFRAVRDMTGILMTGVTGYNVDCVESDTGERLNRFAVVMPAGTKPMTRSLRFGQYHAVGTVQVKDVRVYPIRAEYAKVGDQVLGHGEQVVGGEYSFSAKYGSFGRAHARPFVSHSGSVNFNTHRWHFGRGGELLYRHELKDVEWTSAKVDVQTCYRSSGGVTVEASADGESWTDLATVTNVTRTSVPLPASLFPAARIWVRFRGAKDASIQINGYVFSARTSRPLPEMAGWTRYVDAETGETVGEGRASILFDDSYGETVAGSPSATLWRASSGWKVSRGRKAPSVRGKGVAIRVAANEAESAQLVFAPTADVDDVRVEVASCDDLPDDAISIRRVAYVPVEQPTDEEGARGDWPDPLPPQDASALPVRAGENQPFWITVKPPKGTRKGVRRGVLRVTARRGGSAESWDVPLAVEVFGFELPDETTCRSAFGLNPNRIFRYQKPKDEAEKRVIFERYLKAFSDYRLSPYTPAPFDPFKCTWKPGPSKDRPEAYEPVFDWTAFDREMERVISTYRFNSFRLQIDHIGGGGGAKIRPAQVCAFTGDEPGYQVLMKRYLGAIERHLDEKGWLDKAYVYWFDEPEVSVYPDIMKVFGTLKRHAPRIRRLLTEQPEKALAGGPNLWCPMPHYIHTAAEPARRKAGDTFWWYVCTQPKAPYVTEFIDHAGIEMRLWLWMTWGEDVTGILMWATDYWTDRIRYSDPAHPQDPWTDAMAWSDRGGPWGNGDGRFFYPPKSGVEPVPTVRVELLRDGLEDYEYFAMLRRLDPKNPLLKVPSKVYGSLTEFSRSPEPIESHRLLLAREIERLLKR